MRSGTWAHVVLLSLMGWLIVVAPLAAQERVAPVLSPEVHADHSVTFRLRAPEAETVVLTGEFMPGPLAMDKGDDGVWSVTVGHIAPEDYEYEFTIDGMTFLDPRNPTVKTNQGPSGISSVLTVRSNTPRSFDVRPVPHGTVEIRTYDSDVTRGSRQVYVYTPPGYDSGTEQLPVLYLLHGADGEDRSWTMLGRAHTILDNLIDEGRVAPMVVVMPYGYAYPWYAGASGDVQQSDFLAILTGELIPFIESNYRVSSDREYRALAGLSRGGSQTLTIGLSHLDLFSRLGVFSSSAGNEPEVRLADVAANAAAVNDKLDLFWIGMGTEDGGHARAVLLHDFLTRAGIDHTFRETPGAHTWIVWRQFLGEFAPQLWPT
ncbi:MAG: alpha/beta hydrolase-fold protein [Gemmatimonadota bacterium]|nr:alpha/beta hydrolase-fold protein [Gemmatimonadota bacterium]